MNTTTCILFIALIIIVLGLNHPAAMAQGTRIGFVNSSKILQEYPEAQDANKKLDEMAKMWQAELDRMSKAFEEKLRDYKKKEALMQRKPVPGRR